MTEEALAAPPRLRRRASWRRPIPGLTVLNHEWGTRRRSPTSAPSRRARIAELSEGRLRVDVRVLLNRAVVEHDVALVVGPVLPHEVVGFSGGNKYFFPGVAGQEIIDLSHWLGALITRAEIIGTRRHDPGAGADRRGAPR